MTNQKSETWKSFTKISTETAVCQVNGCAERIGIKGGNTTGMKNHLKKHNIIITQKRGYEKENEEQPPMKKSSNSGIIPFVSRESLPEIISKCAAKDGISFNTIVKSEAIQGFVKNRNYKMPTTTATVQKCVMEFYEITRLETKKYIQAKILLGNKFTITVDKWTDISMRRYLNVTLQLASEQIVLGLVPIIESCTSEKTEELVFLKLQEFGIDFTKDIVASTHDGASVMVKYGRIISAESQCCYNHAIHLAVIETFYRKTTAVNGDEFSEEEDEDEEEKESLFSQSGSQFPEFRLDYNDALEDMRKVIKFFRKSSIRTEILQKNIKKKEGKSLKLLLDVKTRWSSLVAAVSRFLQLVESVNDSLTELGANCYSDEHIILLREILMILEPVQLAVLELSKQTTNLLMAEATLMFVFKELKLLKSPLAEEFQQALKSRIDQRRNKDLISVLMFLHHGVYPKNNEFFAYSTKQVIKSTATSLIHRLYPTNIQDLNSSNEDHEEEEENEHSKLQKYIESFKKQQPNTSQSHYLSMDREFKLLEANAGKRTDRLEKLYQALLTVKPTSTASERVFSVAGIFITKLRNRMNTCTLNALIFLKYYFLSR